MRFPVVRMSLSPSPEEDAARSGRSGGVRHDFGEPAHQQAEGDLRAQPGTGRSEFVADFRWREVDSNHRSLGKENCIAAPFRAILNPDRPQFSQQTLPKSCED